MITMADLGEDRFLEVLSGQLQGGFQRSLSSGGVLALGDDAAILPLPKSSLVVTADAFVEGTHFLTPSNLPPWLAEKGLSFKRGLAFGLNKAILSLRASTPHSVLLPGSDAPADDFDGLWWRAVGHRLAMANLSDLNAMGATPLALLVTAAAPPHLPADHLVKAHLGLAEAGAAAGAPLMGGDTVVTKGPVVFSVTALGQLTPLRPPALRSTARPGQTLCITGCIGAGWLASHFFQNPQAPPADIRAAQKVLITHMTQPPPMDLGLARLPSCVPPCWTDVSDGVARETRRIAQASNAHIALQLENLPIHPAAEKLLSHLSHLERAAHLLASGEEWQLLGCFDSPPSQWRPIGLVKEQVPGGKVTLTLCNNEVNPPISGFEHF
jgi:thiamin-phosphate kinase